MDTFEHRRALTLVLGIVALGLTYALVQVDEAREARQTTPIEMIAGAASRS